jgi:hypothetical protein
LQANAELDTIPLDVIVWPHMDISLETGPRIPQSPKSVPEPRRAQGSLEPVAQPFDALSAVSVPSVPRSVGGPCRRTRFVVDKKHTAWSQSTHKCLNGRDVIGNVMEHRIRADEIVLSLRNIGWVARQLLDITAAGSAKPLPNDVEKFR